MTGDLFGHRLRAERERRKIALESVAEHTKINIGLLRDLERDELSRWPSGIFKRAFIRGYADTIGLDPDETLKEFLEHYPDQPLPGLLEGTSRPDATAALAQLIRPEPRPRTAKPAMRLTLAETPHPFAGGTVLHRVPHRIYAALWDVGTMLGLALLVHVWLGMFWTPLAIIMLCYHAGSVLALGNTPGVYFFAPALRNHDDAPPTPPDDADVSELSRASFHPRGVS